MSYLPSSRSNARYLDARVLTASQPELQLMLLEGALRFGQQARQLWIEGARHAEADRLMGRAIEVVEELVRGVAGSANEASQRLEEEYAFLFRHLTAARINRSAPHLDEALRLLAYQRETWKLACERLRSQPEALRPEQGAGPHVPWPAVSLGDFSAGGPGLSLEA